MCLDESRELAGARASWQLQHKLGSIDQGLAQVLHGGAAERLRSAQQLLPKRLRTERARDRGPNGPGASGDIRALT